MYNLDIVYGIGAAWPDPSGKAVTADRHSRLSGVGPATGPAGPAIVQRALRLIAEGALDQGSVGELAACLGIGERHLRRLFKRCVGISPVNVAQARRLCEAWRLVCETDRSMAEIALAAGFNSVRRFNAAFHAHYGCSPREMRRRRGDRPPYALVLPSTRRTPPASQT